MTPSERLLRQFRDLVTVRLERITRSLMELESGASAEAGRGVLRELHGLKGEARMMGFDDVNVLVHEMEELVRCTEPLRYALSPASTDALLTTADAVLVFSGTQAADEPPPAVERLVAWLQECVRSESVRLPPGSLAPAEGATPSPEAVGRVGAQGGPPATVRASPGASPGRLLTVPVAEGSRPHVPSAGRSAMPSRVSPPASGTAASSGVGARATSSAPTVQGSNGISAPRQPEPRPDTAVRIGVESLDLLTSAVTNLTQVARRRELANARRLALARELSQLAREAEDLGPAGAALAARLGSAKEMAAVLHRESKLLSNAELRDLGMLVEEVQTLRMLPLSVLFEPYPRMVRDLSRVLGKEVELVVDGEDTRADRAVVEALREPLMHLVRNALDHGLETRVDRVTADKKPRGCLTLRAAREGSRIILRVEDDGMGVDPVQLRKVAVRRGLFDESAANALSDAAARELIFLPGFTSRDVVTDLSGRGVGLDAVRTSIQALGGDVGVESAPGWGTIFELRVPVSLTVAPLLFIQVGTETLALSATHVSRALKVDSADQCEVAGRPSLLVEGRVLPLAPLSSLLGLGPPRPAREGELALVVKSQSGAAALVVDRVLEERVQAILPLKGILGRFGHLTGATSLADGRLAMVLSAAFLTASAHHGNALPRPPPSVAPGPEARRRRILVVDDSPLTRELIANLLEAVGYDTVIASDGAEALEVLDSHPVDLAVTDLEMPGVDGLELARRLKGHPVHSRLPVVILTTRGGEEDRRRGLAAGVDGYITKGDLVRQDLVDVVRRLLG
ncbi:hybrid sensor histidine kinase/response regulator [Myxococcus xanthus]|uniref:hybrid sensor histidine kinase/response regulator n=1 Tax=Myxococcus xanthus TaxID=34 RepID=UPI00112B3A52|nr:response regulator [Myxococcus xanthus]QDE84784.1 hybrid sensor histidine kinase/response regulator [Myxococcus xanthus]QDE98947.1 hybrid sensor histidine kinase/response regulator [Myxococcus xanthus]QDF06613.1 hybrid sensor histidine kinase/response regulator [Myxococcus xanthus]